MKTVTILMMFLFWMTSHVMAGVLLPEPSLDSLAVDELSLKASGVEVKDMPTVRPEVLSSEERQLLRYSVKVAKINTQWTPLYGTASKTRVISSAPFLKEIRKRNEQAISAISSQTVVYDLKQGEDKSELTLTLSFSKEGELKTEAFNVKEGKKSLFFSLKTPSTLKKTQYQSLIANKLLELLGKEEEKVSNWELISVRPFRYAQDKALFAFQLPKHKDLTLEINPMVATTLVSLKGSDFLLSLNQIMIEGSKEVKTIQAPKDLLTTMTSGVQTQAPQLENVRKDMEKAILTAHPADISFAVSNLLDLLEEWPIAWELMPEEFKDEETLVSTLTDVITRAQQLHMTDQILKFIETQFDPSNAASLLNQSRYEKVTAPHLVIKKKLEHTTVYTGWINGSLKLWLGGEEI